MTEYAIGLAFLRRHVQRITAVDGMCLAQEAAIGKLVSQLGTEWASLASARFTSDEDAPLSFAVAFKSRQDEQQKQQAQAGSKTAKNQKCEEAAPTQQSPAEVSLSAGLPDSAPSQEQSAQQTASADSKATSPGKDCESKSQQPAAAEDPVSNGGKACEVAPAAGGIGKDAELSGEDEPASTFISRGAAIAAAAESFSAACRDAGIKIKVNLKVPHTVICVEILPVGSSVLAAISIVKSGACILKPKLTMKPLHEGK